MTRRTHPNHSSGQHANHLRPACRCPERLCHRARDHLRMEIWRCSAHGKPCVESRYRHDMMVGRSGNWERCLHTSRSSVSVNGCASSCPLQSTSGSVPRCTSRCSFEHLSHPPIPESTAVGQDADEYLRQVQWERLHCPQAVSPEVTTRHRYTVG